MKNRIGLLCIFLLLTACASTPRKPLSPAVQQTCLLKALSEGGVRLLVVGDEWRLILPNSRFFVEGTPRLKVNSYPTLTRIVTLLNQRKNLSIKVLTFTPMSGLMQKTSDLAKQQALAIEDYLLDHGLNTRIIVAQAWSRADQYDERGGSFNEDSPEALTTEIRTRHLLPEDSE